MQIRARAPVRFCDLGGWTDTRVVPRGAVLNVAARLYTYVTLTIREGQSGITLESLDTDERVRRARSSSFGGRKSLSRGIAGSPRFADDASVSRNQAEAAYAGSSGGSRRGQEDRPHPSRRPVSPLVSCLEGCAAPGPAAGHEALRDPGRPEEALGR